MKIKILSDSTCDLSPELVAANDIGILPLTVNKGDESLRDMIDITPADIFAWVSNGGDLCKTSAPSPVEYEDFFKEYAKDYDAVIHINLGSGFSVSHQNAKMAAMEFDNVYVVDSKNLSTGQGHLVLEAAKAVREGKEPSVIVDELNELTGRIETSFILDQLEYLAKGGRCSALAAFGANVLKLKPCIDLIDGKLTTGKKYRGAIERCVGEYVKDKLAGREDIIPERIFITYTDHKEAAVQAARDGVSKYGNFETVLETKAGCTVSCHCGPATLGVLFIRQK